MEVLDIVNDKDEIIGKAPYAEIHQKKLLHRVTHVMLFNDGGEMLLQLRAEHKSTFPLHWSFSIGGHVRHGETYEKALVREAKEEVGLNFSPEDFVFRGSGTYTDELGHRVWYKTYSVQYDGPVEANQKEEVAAVQFVTWETLRTMIAEKKEKFQPELLEILQRHYVKEFSQHLDA